MSQSKYDQIMIDFYIFDQNQVLLNGRFTQFNCLSDMHNIDKGKIVLIDFIHAMSILTLHYLGNNSEPQQLYTVELSYNGLGNYVTSDVTSFFNSPVKRLSD